MIFNAVSNRLGNYICEFIDCILSLTSDVKIFSELNLLSHTHSWCGSEIPILQGELDKLLKIKKMILNGYESRSLQAMNRNYYRLTMKITYTF